MKYDKDLAKLLLETPRNFTVLVYKGNKKEKVGSNITCPSCGTSFAKKSYQHTFCCSQCKDNFWDHVVKERRERREIWNEGKKRFRKQLK